MFETILIAALIYLIVSLVGMFVPTGVATKEDEARK